jgi:hypothetical protein
MTDLERAYGELAHEADGVVLPPPERLRDRGNRRSRLRLATGVLAVAMVVGAGTAGVGWVLRADPSGPDPRIGSSRTPTAAATPSADLPDSAFLRPADLRSGVERVPSVDRQAIHSLCGARFPSDLSVDKRRTVQQTWRPPSVPIDTPTINTTIIQTVTLYRSDGAARYLDEIRAAVGACPRQQADGFEYRYRLVTGPTLGDESILIEWELRLRSPQPANDYGYIPVVRVGNAITVLSDTTFEGIGWAPRATMQRFAELAAGYLRTVR